MFTIPSTAGMSSGQPAGPLGCGGAMIVLGITIVAMVAFIFVVGLMMRDAGAL